MSDLILPERLRPPERVVRTRSITREQAAELMGGIPWFAPPPEAIRRRDAKLASQFYLVRIGGNAGFGDTMLCKGPKGPNGVRQGGCGGRHRYLTLRCVEMPVSGLEGGLYAYYKATRDSGAVAFMNPRERAKFEAIARAVGSQPDLNTAHPLTARALGTGDRDMDLGAMALGILEPISRTKALDLARRINSRGLTPPFTLPGL